VFSAPVTPIGGEGGHVGTTLRLGGTSCEVPIGTATLRIFDWRMGAGLRFVIETKVAMVKKNTK